MINASSKPFVPMNQNLTFTSVGNLRQLRQEKPWLAEDHPSLGDAFRGVCQRRPSSSHILASRTHDTSACSPSSSMWTPCPLWHQQSSRQSQPPCLPKMSFSNSSH